MQVVDFTNLPRRNKLYAGANGSKISVIYEGQQYMLKFPPLPSKNKEMSYSNSCFSEYLGCQIYESIGNEKVHHDAACRQLRAGGFFYACFGVGIQL